MATKRMLVDATHPEETRIVVMNGNRLEEFDFESAARRQLRGNIYLAKVTRVEPSLQAAFVEYGGNRHGFLAFSEIHPDYYQIPVADREALLADEEAEEKSEAAAEEDEASQPNDEDEADQDFDSSDDGNGDGQIEQLQAGDDSVESVGGGDALEEVPERRRGPVRKYKIQEVIKRRQVMLVQVVKEERGNKGAALTTYLSLAGRYSVLMPNTARGGGISRKITSAADRKRLKEIAHELDVPAGMGVILRTAGASRTKAEVKRDFEYLMRLWENVRSLTLNSTAPCLVYEEGSLIKRTIRDLYSKDIGEVLVAGDAAYREAKDFMRMIMPSHAKNVKPYKEDQNIFSRYNVEAQLDSMFSPQVTLPSGGYIVINPTEALVSIDVNSGRATKEHNIEDTALQTNLEAADEVSRQLRLRDLAGLIVIDFIDMMEKRSNRLVERRLKDALKNDRARIQVGRISHFGLMEMSRQRMRFGVLESSTHVCPTCAGSGIVRSVESLALMVLRAIEDHVRKRPGQSINVKVATDVALYLLNAKRGALSDLELRYDLSVTISADAKAIGSNFSIERGEARIAPPTGARPQHVSVDTAEIVDVEEEDEEEAQPEAVSEVEQPSRRKRRRRRGRGGSDEAEQHQVERAASRDEDEETESDEAEARADGEGRDEDEGPRKRRRRGRRGGRRNRRTQQAEGQEPEAADDIAARQEVEGGAEPMPQIPQETASTAASTATPVEAVTERAEPVAEADAKAAAEGTDEKPKKPRRSRRKKAEQVVEQVEAAPAESAADAESVAHAVEDLEGARVSEPEEAKAEEPEAKADEEPAEPKGPRRRKKELPADEIVVTSSGAKEEEGEKKPKRGGWWQRGFFS